MARLVVIDGPRTGDWVQLYRENWLGFRGGQLSVSTKADLQQQWAFIRLLPDRAELHNLGVGPHVLLNNAQFANAFINHGDIIAIYDTRFLVEIEDENSQSVQLPAFRQAAMPQPTPRVAAPLPGQGLSEAAVPGHEDELLGSVSLSAANEQINHRIRYRDEDEMLATVKDAKRLKILLQVAAKLSTLDLAQLMGELLDIMFSVLPADRGTILLFDPERRRFRSMASKLRSGGEAKVRVSRTIAREVLRTKEAILSADAQADDRFSLGMSIVDDDIRSALCVPILSGDTIIGLVHLDSQNEDQQFDRADLELLAAICMQAALAIENSRLVSEIAEQERLKYELDLAAAIQQQLLPRRLPKVTGLSVFGKMIPAKELGGDYFDFIDHGQGECHICIGDVSGKGLPAGLVMVMARSYLRPLTRATRSPRAIVSEVNRLLYSDTRREMFMSALMFHWSDVSGRLVWCGAGHEHLIVYRAHEGKAEAIKAGGVVLGMMRDSERLLQELELELSSGDAVVLYTDGVTEAINTEGEFFADGDPERLTELVARYGHLSARDLLDAVLWELKQFMGAAPQADDITLVTMKKT